MPTVAMLLGLTPHGRQVRVREVPLQHLPLRLRAPQVVRLVRQLAA
jgi:hypothetical protein